MNLPLTVLRPFLGARIIKTALAVFIVLALFHVLAADYASFAAVAAILAVQPSVYRAREVFIEQLLGNLIGGLIGVLIGLYLGSGPPAMALGVVLSLGICSRLKLNEAANLAVVVVIFVMDRPQHDFLLYTGARMGAISGGMLIGALVNRFVRPPNYTRRLREQLLAASEAVDAFGKHLVTSLHTPEFYLKEDIKAEAAAIQARLEACRYYLDLSHESTSANQRHAVLSKAISSLFVCMERITDIHKVVLGLGGLQMGRELAAASQLLSAILKLKQKVIQAVLAEVPLRSEALSDSAEAMAQLEELVDRMIDDPETRTRGLGLHTIMANTLHMKWRLESLMRLVNGHR